MQEAQKLEKVVVNERGHLKEYDALLRAGKMCRHVDNIGARLGSEANFGSQKIKISS